MTRSISQRADTTRLTILAVLAVAFVGATLVLMPDPIDSTVTDVQAAPVAAEPFAAAPATFDTVPTAAEVFVDGSTVVPDLLVPTF